MGPEAAAWIAEHGVTGRVLLPWQRHALDRILELKPDGSLRWQKVILTVARQSGKSLLTKELAWWRLHHPTADGEPALVIHTSNVAHSAAEVWRAGALKAIEVYGRATVKMGRGHETIDLTEHGHGRWLVQPPSPALGVGYSTTMGIVDEAWSVSRSVIDESLLPSMSAVKDPQLVLLSTAGDGGSDLLVSYRDQALRDLTTGTGDTLLLEWSAPNESPVDDPQTWKWASPFWSDRREEFLRSQVESIPEASFASQYLNIWTRNRQSWIPSAVWEAATVDALPTRHPEVIAVEVAVDGSRFAAVGGWRDGDQVIVSSFVTLSPSALWGWIDGQTPGRLLLPPAMAAHYAGRIPVTVVGQKESGMWLGSVARAILDGRVLHWVGDHALTEDILRTSVVATEVGSRISRHRSTGPVEATRALVWVAGELMKPPPVKPAIHVRKPPTPE